MEQNIYKRMAKVEAMANLQKSQLVEVLQNAYNAACLAKDEQAASDTARTLRNRLLDLSDKEVSPDRLNIDIDNNMCLSISDLEDLSIIEWIVYRQILRDIPQQKGFPFNIIFPDEPNKDKQEIL